MIFLISKFRRKINSYQAIKDLRTWVLMKCVLDIFSLCCCRPQCVPTTVVSDDIRLKCFDWLNCQEIFHINSPPKGSRNHSQFVNPDLSQRRLDCSELELVEVRYFDFYPRLILILTFPIFSVLKFRNPRKESDRIAQCSWYPTKIFHDKSNKIFVMNS